MDDLDLDFEVAKAAMAVRLFERALHDRGRWSLSWANHTVEAERIITATGIIIRGEFDPNVCFLVEPEPIVHLLVDGEVVAAHRLEVHPGEGSFTLDWTLSLTPAQVGA